MTSNNSGVWRRPIALAGLLFLLSGCTGLASEENPVSEIEGVPAAPLAERTIACMKEAGWDASLDWDGTITGPEMTGALASQWVEAADVCGKKTGFQDPQLNDEQIQAVFEQEKAEAACLRMLGYQVEEPPSSQTYVDTYGTADQYYAHASLDLQALGISKMREALSACPPPTMFLNVPGL